MNSTVEVKAGIVGSKCDARRCFTSEPRCRSGFEERRFNIFEHMHENKTLRGRFSGGKAGMFPPQRRAFLTERRGGDVVCFTPPTRRPPGLAWQITGVTWSSCFQVQTRMGRLQRGCVVTWCSGVACDEQSEL